MAGCWCLLLVLLSLHLAASVDGQVDFANESCSSDFHLMEQSLLKSTENRFRLLRAFYPLTEANPVLVRVEYSFDGLDNHSLIWFWTESHFYLIQPLEIFQFTSLMFSNMPYRQGNISLLLNAGCISAPLQYFQLLTARVSFNTYSAFGGARLDIYIASSLRRAIIALSKSPT